LLNGLGKARPGSFSNENQKIYFSNQLLSKKHKSTREEFSIQLTPELGNYSSKHEEENEVISHQSEQHSRQAEYSSEMAQLEMKSQRQP
jgi:hypothetical protein